MKKLNNKEEILEKLRLDLQSWTEWRRINKFEELELRDEKFTERIFNNFSFQHINFYNVQFIDCKINSATFGNSIFENVEFRKSELDKSTFLNIKAFNINFNGSMGNNLSLTNSSLDSSQLFNNQITSKNFSGSYFRNIDLSNKNATSISFSNVKIDKKTKNFAKKNPNITIGINGIYNKINNTASLQNEKPKGDEMLGGDEEVILSSLSKSKRAFATSASAAIIAFSIKFIGINSISSIGLNAKPETFSLLALPIIFFSLYKSNVILNDVILGIKYIRTQTGAMKVGRFPWLISRFWGISKSKKIESFIFRFIYCMHPLLLFPFLKNWLFESNFKATISQLTISDDLFTLYCNNAIIIIVIIWSLYILILIFAIKLFLKSQKFQKPLLFDLKNPIKDDNDINKLANSIENINKLLSDFFGNTSYNSIDWRDLNSYIKTKKELAEKELKEIRTRSRGHDA